MDAYTGEIRLFGGNFAPRSWAFCDGQLMPISQNTALFSLLGTTYGGDGISTFALPDLRGRAPMHWGTGPGLSPFVLGETSGVDTVTLLTSQMPAHTHQAQAATSSDEQEPQNAVWAQGQSGRLPYEQYSDSVNTTMSPLALTATGGSQAHNNLQPYQVVNFIICLYGVYPPHS
ncbi:phage tail protein [Gallaecimonas mangrovi]|uniref:phage tail protein n=1 Tax=Gallaecimonas mangrovi TaxID=2291597 RepID=UPI000E1FE80E|nr:tail fiber protein [Gallaecimonas mangrovi]